MMFGFFVFRHLNIGTKRFKQSKRSNIQTLELEIQIFRCCTHKIWTNELHNLILTICIVEQNNHFQVAADIRLTFSLNVSWMLMFVYRWRRGDNFPFLLGLFWLSYQRFHSLNFLSIIWYIQLIVNMHELEIWNFQRISQFHLRLRYLVARDH